MQERKTITVKRNGHTVEFFPLTKPCARHYPEQGKKCRNCNNTGKYMYGYHMIIDGKTGWFVDTIK